MQDSRESDWGRVKQSPSSPTTTPVFTQSGTVLRMLHMYKHEHKVLTHPLPKGVHRQITGGVQRRKLTPHSGHRFHTFINAPHPPSSLHRSSAARQQQNPPTGFSSRPPVQNVQKSPLAFFRFTCFQPGRPPYSSLLISRAFCRSSRAHRQQKAAPAPSLGYQNSQKNTPTLAQRRPRNLWEHTHAGKNDIFYHFTSSDTLMFLHVIQKSCEDGKNFF